MLTKLSHTEFDSFEIINTENIECPVDIEYLLPDYCPDVQKILKCLPYPEITSYSFTQDKLMCEGKLVLYIQYMDGKSGTIRVCEISREYSVAKEISGDKILGKISASCGHIICRAISARKLDIHIPVVLCATTTGKRQEKITKDVEFLEKKTETIQVSHAVNELCHTFVLEQELELSQSCPPIESILRKSVNISGTKCTMSSGKVQLEGVAEISVIYRTFSENLSVEKMSYSIPFTQSVEVQGAEPGGQCNADFTVYEFAVQPREDSSGECTICMMYLKLCADICIYEEKELTLIVDAYATKGTCDMKYQNINLTKFEGKYQEPISQTKGIFFSEDEIEKILDLWCDEVVVTPYCEKNKISYRGKYNICLIYQGKSKQIFSVTKTYDFSITRGFEDLAQRRSEAKATMQIKDYKIIDGNNVEIQCTGMLYSADYMTQTKRVLMTAEAVQSAESSPQSAITVYYSNKDEDLWDIGKKYTVAVQSIIDSNSLAEPFKSPGGPLAIF